MIHLTVATPMGIDSLFFSYVQRLAQENGHGCIDPPADCLDEEKPGHWIKAMSQSSQHHFVVGYRYPPSYWKQLMEHAATVAVLVDGDGIARQLESIIRQERERGEELELSQSLLGIRNALDAMVDITESMLGEADPLRLLAPAIAFQADAEDAFSRLETFYREASVPIHTSCWQVFSKESNPFLNRIQAPSPDIKTQIMKILSLEKPTPERINALEMLFSNH